MLNVLIQLSTLVYGLMINFLAPVVFGLSAYGEFIAHNAVVLLIFRAMTILSEPLIRFTQPGMILVSSLTLNAAVLALFLCVSHFVPMGSPVLLAGILLSVSVLLSMQAQRLRRSYIGFQVVTSAIFGAGCFWSATHDFRLPLLGVMQLSAGVPTVCCVVYLFARGARIPSGRELVTILATVLRQVPRLISITAVMNLLTSALPVFLAPLLPARELGLFKVMTSVIQSSTTVFPVSTQVVLANFVHHARGAEFYRLLSSMAVLYFATACFAMSAAALLVPVLVPYVVLAACLPVYYQAILSERHLTATGHIRTLVVVNWCIVGLVAGLFAGGEVTTLMEAALLYAGGFTLYAIALAFAEREYTPFLPLLLAIALCPYVVHLVPTHPAAGIGYGVLLLIVSLLNHCPTRAEVRLLWQEL